jgi:NAD(P)-dependent dehydrogenase (short-subunit alcohol dehydrogenase family)
MLNYHTALVIGAGDGISASLARTLEAEGVRVGIVARSLQKLERLADEVGATPFVADAADPAAVEDLFARVDRTIGEPDIVIYNPGARAHGSLTDIDPEAVRHAIEICAFGGFLATQQAARRMVPKGRGAILLTGATASLKGFARSSAFAMGKFALRGLAQSAARELGPKGIHVAHIVIDGAVRKAGEAASADRPDGKLSPDSIARTYLDTLRQTRDAWSQEVELRPWIENF